MEAITRDLVLVVGALSVGSTAIAETTLLCKIETHYEIADQRYKNVDDSGWTANFDDQTLRVAPWLHGFCKSSPTGVVTDEQIRFKCGESGERYRYEGTIDRYTGQFTYLFFQGEDDGFCQSGRCEVSAKRF